MTHLCQEIRHSGARRYDTALPEDMTHTSRCDFDDSWVGDLCFTQGEVVRTRAVDNPNQLLSLYHMFQSARGRGRVWSPSTPARPNLPSAGERSLWGSWLPPHGLLAATAYSAQTSYGNSSWAKALPGVCTVATGTG